MKQHRITLIRRYTRSLVHPALLLVKVLAIICVYTFIKMAALLHNTLFILQQYVIKNFSFTKIRGLNSGIYKSRLL